MYGLRCCKKNKIIMKNTLQTNINDDNINKEIINMFKELEVEDINEINKLKNV
tara:strand:+ start:435 stop:593 length:159 start_codon:yes stop_codon:yes gene_type:complete